MRVVLVFLGHDFQQAIFDRAHVLAGREPGAIRDAEDVRVDRDRRMTERGVENHVRGLASDARQRFQRFARFGHFAAVLFDAAAGTSAMTFCAFELNRPIVRMYARQAFDAERRESPAAYSRA